MFCPILKWSLTRLYARHGRIQNFSKLALNSVRWRHESSPIFSLPPCSDPPSLDKRNEFHAPPPSFYLSWFPFFFYFKGDCTCKHLNVSFSFYFFVPESLECEFKYFENTAWLFKYLKLIKKCYGKVKGKGGRGGRNEN